MACSAVDTVGAFGRVADGDTPRSGGVDVNPVVADPGPDDRHGSVTPDP